MMKYSFRNTLRIIKRQKIYSLINISGLALGMASCLIILLWVNNEIRYDRFHDRIDNLYRVVNDLDFGPYALRAASSAYPLGPALKESFPEIQDVARFLTTRTMLVASSEKRFYEDDFCFADPSFFKMFSFPFIRGNRETALSTPLSVVLTEDMAAKYFGSENPIGKTLRTHNQNDFTITGVIENVPENSHLTFDFLASMERAVTLGARIHWGGWLYRTYVLLRPGASYQSLNAKMEPWIETTDSSSATYLLQPLKDVYLYGVGGEGAIRSISLFSLLAVLVLIIACINYMNLATAQAGSRAKEIGLRKVIGADKRNIWRQFLGESIVFALLALVIAIFIVELFLPLFNQLSGKQLELNLVRNQFLFFGILGLTLLTGLLAGAYPAFFFSSLQPVVILKSGTTFRKRGSSGSSLRKILVVCQFILSIVLIASTIVVYRQVHYVQNRDMGFDKDHLIYAQLRSEENLWDKYDAAGLWQNYSVLKQRILTNPSVREVTATTCIPFGAVANEFGSLDWKGRDPEHPISFNHMAVDEDFLETFQLELIRGKFFSEASLSDSNNFVLNEAAAAATGLESPLGERFTLGDKTGTIVGIVKDFHYESFHSEIEPLILHTMPYQDWQYRHYVFIKIGAIDIQGTIASIENAWDEVMPEYPFEFRFLDAQIDDLYRREQSLRAILRLFTSMALFISCIGLFGLVSFAAARRTKEVSIRKVLGASVPGLLRLLSKELLTLVVVANVVAWPVAYFIMKHWLENFAFRIKIGMGTFFFSGLLALALAVLTVSYKAVKAAAANPVDSLRYE